MNQKPRVLYVEMAHGMGGSVISLHQLVRGLDRSRYEPIVLFYWDNAYVQRFRDLGVETIVWGGTRQAGNGLTPLAAPLHPPRRLARWQTRWPLLSKLYHGVGLYARTLLETIPLAWRIRHLIHERRIDLVHANDLVGCNREVIIAARLTGKPCLCHIRAFEDYTSIDRFLIRFVDRFVFISQAIAASCIAQGADPTRGVVIYNALDTAEFGQLYDDGSSRQALGFGPDDLVVGIIGRLVRWKGQDTFLRAMAQVADAVPRLHCLIIGDAAPDSEGQAFRRELDGLTQTLGLTDRVHFLGWRSDVPQLLSVMDVLVHASLEPEPFGRVLIEGMAAGKPVVAAAAGACPEIIDDGVSGLLVPPGDADALANAVRSLLQSPDRMRAMGMVARRQVELRFSIAEHVRQVEQLYSALVPSVS